MKKDIKHILIMLCICFSGLMFITGCNACNACGSCVGSGCKLGCFAGMAGCIKCSDTVVEPFCSGCFNAC